MIYAWFVEAITFIFKTRMGLMLATCLAWLGVNYVTIKIGIDPIIALLDVKMGALSGASGYGATMYQWLVVFHFPGCVAMIVSAYVSRLAIGSIKMHMVKAGV